MDSHKLRKGHLSSEDMEKLIDAGGVLQGTKLFIDDTPGQGMLRIAANARRLKLRHGIKLVVIDYLQLIEPDNRRDSRQEQVAHISRRSKFLARASCKSRSSPWPRSIAAWKTGKTTSRGLRTCASRAPSSRTRTP